MASTIRRSTKTACGVGFIADIKGRKSHQIVEDGLKILCNLEHRGATGADPRMGDGAGILVQIPHKFFAKEAAKLGFTLPAPGEYAIGQLFMPVDANWRQIIRDIYAEVIAREGLTLLGWRDVPTDNSTLGESVKPTEPTHHAGVHRPRQEEAVARTSSSAGSTSCASRSRTRSTSGANGASPAITRCRSPAAR